MSVTEVRQAPGWYLALWRARQSLQFLPTLKMHVLWQIKLFWNYYKTIWLCLWQNQHKISHKSQSSYYCSLFVHTNKRQHAQLHIQYIFSLGCWVPLVVNSLMQVLAFILLLFIVATRTLQEWCHFSPCILEKSQYNYTGVLNIGYPNLHIRNTPIGRPRYNVMTCV